MRSKNPWRYKGACYRQTSQDALKALSTASFAPQPVNRAVSVLTVPFCYQRLAVTDSFGPAPEAKAFFREPSAGRAGGFPNRQKIPGLSAKPGIFVLQSIVKVEFNISEIGHYDNPVFSRMVDAVLSAHVPAVDGNLAEIYR